MGLSFFSKCSSSCCSTVDTTRRVVEKVLVLPNPNPRNFSIKEMFQEGKHLIVVVNYPNCTNYEGNKVMLYTNTTIEQFLSMREVDPHFCDKAEKSPFARFEPTLNGIESAKTLARILK